MVRAAVFVVWSIAAGAAVVVAQTLPKPAGKVGDAAGVLTPAARACLESLLTTLEQDTAADVVVATTTSLEGLSVEAYGKKVFDEWQLGKAARDSGVLVLVAPTERKMRLEVGSGLVTAIPDDLAAAIIRDDFIPSFRDGKYEAGILAGVRRVVDTIRAKRALPLERTKPLESSASPTSSTSPASSAAASSSRPGLFDWILFGTIGAMWLAGVVMAGTMFGQALNIRSGPNLVFGILGTGIFAGLPIAFLPRTALVLVPIALAGGAWGYRRRPLSGARAGASTDHWDWTTPTGSSGSDSSSSSSGSSDSGGSSGGASGSW
jgi:uncharacterized membrane protein YgcG